MLVMKKKKFKPGAAARARYEERKASPLDLPDSLHDEERMQPEEVTINLPDVSDIPGQEHIRPMPLGELADTTASSDDEEGTRIFGDDRKRTGDPSTD